MARRSGLGKGLDSLIPVVDGMDQDGPGAVLIDIATSAVVPNPHQPRVHFDEESLVELAASIAAMGVLQPILVRQVDDGAYELIAGERRWRAATRAGLTMIPAVVRTSDKLGSMEQALVENLHREDLTPLEEAAAYQQLIEEFELTHDDLSKRVGRSRSAISNTIRLLGLPPAVQRLLADGKLSAGHARALLSTPDRGRQEELARAAVAEGWSVRQIEVAVRDDGGTAVTPEPIDDDARGSGELDGAGLTPTTKLRPPGLLELENLLAEHLETRVKVQMGAKRGRVTIDFADLEDLERLYRLMAG
ncbi:MAG: ParB/RepB/Spo0J family partition protein [Acidimicrobiia bacterium]|nr:ParB/RepB/Spo0J family partition protein [Acidimicrobiia bacterium]